MLCYKCHRELDEKAAFCKFCGAKQHVDGDKLREEKGSACLERSVPSVHKKVWLSAVWRIGFILLEIIVVIPLMQMLMERI